MFIPLHDANYLRHIRLQYVTLAIILVNSAIWLLMTAVGMSSANTVRAAFFSYGFIPAVANGYETLPADLERLPDLASYVTYAFLHGDFMHLAGNMLFVWVFGDNVEDAMGHLRFLGFFVLCAVAGAIAHAFAQPYSQSPLIGASGAAAGVITAYLMLHPHVKVWILALGRIPLRISAIWVIGAWILFQVGNFLLSSDDQVSWAAHVGGILAGAVLLPILKRGGVPLFDRRPVDEVLPPVPPPAVAEEGYALPGQPRTAEGRLPDDEAPRQTEETTAKGRQMPWGRQPR